MIAYITSFLWSNCSSQQPLEQPLEQQKTSRLLDMYTVSKENTSKNNYTKFKLFYGKYCNEKQYSVKSTDDDSILKEIADSIDSFAKETTGSKCVAYYDPSFPCTVKIVNLLSAMSNEAIALCVMNKCLDIMLFEKSEAKKRSFLTQLANYLRLIKTSPSVDDVMRASFYKTKASSVRKYKKV